jgi:hypothetical protein
MVPNKQERLYFVQLRWYGIFEDNQPGIFSMSLPVNKVVVVAKTNKKEIV